MCNLYSSKREQVKIAMPVLRSRLLLTSIRFILPKMASMFILLFFASCCKDQQDEPKESRLHTPTAPIGRASTQLAMPSSEITKRRVRAAKLQNELAKVRRALSVSRTDLARQTRVSATLQNELVQARRALSAFRTESAIYRSRIAELEDDSDTVRSSLSLLLLQTELERRQASIGMPISATLPNELAQASRTLSASQTESARYRASTGMPIAASWQVSLEDGERPHSAEGCLLCYTYESFLMHGMCRCPNCKKELCQACYRKCRQNERSGVPPKCPYCRVEPLY